MYTPKVFQVDDEDKIVQFIKANSFGILFSTVDGQPFATHLPFLLEENNHALWSHMAKQNPQWEDLHNKEVLVVFQGPHAYISPTWYHEPNTVPTWNYVAVHVYGTFQLIDDKEMMKHLLEKTVDFYESSMPTPWKVEFDDFTEHLMEGTVCFKINIQKIEGKWKLSQNHSIQRQKNLIKGLKTVDHYHSKEIAALMEQNILDGMKE
ncbi:transcriptional regulator [Anoxybacillus voinovskiensis]|uniref:Transcriptional regulator n=1 Tax=Anoxybacteroides voinovskiense TaxID=230470 RepID=A0A840DZV2_9BACL|nr:FMN-binding negative transcriptional regulator [Anoxybacillus voinovskiensis]MBB4074516.1 transcriptional regulator [Anoxybacillus voinovskiensis]GGJ71457.1 protease synthase and sporulation protein PAI 2 [Anoxybacillus voinovskiensis]